MVETETSGKQNNNIWAYNPPTLPDDAHYETVCLTHSHLLKRKHVPARNNATSKSLVTIK